MRRKKPVAKIRLSLELSDAVRGQLEGLQARTGADSMSEVIRRSLALYDCAWGVQESGGSVIVENRDGTREKVILV